MCVCGGGDDFWGNVGELGGKGGLLVCRLFMYVYQNISRKAILAGARGHRGRGVGARGKQDMNSILENSRQIYAQRCSTHLGLKSHGRGT